MFCTKCGKEFEENFYPICGTSAVSNNMHSEETAPKGNVETQPGPQQPKKKSNRKTVLIIATALFLLVGAAGLMEKYPEKFKGSLNSASASDDLEEPVSSMASSVSSEVPKDTGDIETALLNIGLTEEEAAAQVGKFSDVGITKLFKVKEGLGQGIDELQAFSASAQDDQNILFTVENRDIFYIGYYGTDLYDRDSGGVLADISSVYVTETDVDIATSVQLQSGTENAIKQILIAPSTAKFPWMDGWSVTRTDNEYVVSGYVDAQNSFGAMLRSYFTVYWEKGTDSFKVTKVIFDGEEIKVG